MEYAASLEALLVQNEKVLPAPGFHVEVLRGEVSLQLNGQFNSDGAQNAEGKDYHSIEMVFPLICGAVDQDTAFMEDVELTKANCL